jgi:hypothetical protein
MVKLMLKWEPKKGVEVAELMWAMAVSNWCASGL